MPNFHFSAKDMNGNLTSGEISAGTANDALKQLAARQLRIQKLEISVAPPPGTMDKNSVIKTASRQATPPVAATPVAPAQPALQQNWDTPKWKYRDLSFFAGQIAARLRAGITAAQAFEGQADLSCNPKEASALRAIAHEISNGGDLPTAMLRYPKMFPDYAASIVRVGQVGGFLPQAFEKLAEQAMTTHSFHRWLWAIWIAFYNLAAIIPMAVLAGKLIGDVYEKYEKEGGGRSTTEIYFETLGKLILWPTGPAWLAASFLIFATTWILNRPKTTPLRHRLGAKHRYIRKRAKQENLAIFTWSLEGLVRGGMSANSAWKLAADSCPNHYYRKLLNNMGVQVNEGTKLAEALHQSNLFPPDYVNLVATGEYTGTTTDAIQRIRKLTEDEFRVQSGYSKGLIGFSAFLWFFIAGLAATAIFFYFFYRVFYGKVLDGLDI